MGYEFYSKSHINQDLSIVDQHQKDLLWKHTRIRDEEFTAIEF